MLRCCQEHAGQRITTMIMRRHRRPVAAPREKNAIVVRARGNSYYCPKINDREAAGGGGSQPPAEWPRAPLEQTRSSRPAL